MLVHLDTSVLLDAFTGPRRLLPAIRRATAAREVLTFSAIVQYEWRRGPRTSEELDDVAKLFPVDTLASFGWREAERAAALYRQATRARQRQADLAIAACAIERGARLWTLNRQDFRDIPGLLLYDA